MEITIVVSIQELESMIKTTKGELAKDSGPKSVIIEHERDNEVSFQLYHKETEKDSE